MPESLYDGPQVAPSDHLHFHACIACTHSWPCRSLTCLQVRDIALNPLTDRPDPRLRLPDRCRRHPV